MSDEFVMSCFASKDDLIAALKERVAVLEARKCSHGDYRMQGTTDCKNAYSSPDCSGRTEFYVIGDGLCISCRHKLA